MGTTGTVCMEDRCLGSRRLSLDSAVSLLLCVNLWVQFYGESKMPFVYLLNCHVLLERTEKLALEIGFGLPLEI